MIDKTPRTTQIGGFWRREKNGEKYLAGKIMIDGREKILELWTNPDKIDSDDKKYDIICKLLEIK